MMDKLLVFVLFSVSVYADELKTVSPQYQNIPIPDVKQLPKPPENQAQLPPVQSVAEPPKAKYPNVPLKNVFHFSGFVIYVDQLEGGFYGILSRHGEKYLPTNLSEAHRQSGLEVEVMAQFVDKEMNNKMWGRYIRLISIKPRRP